MKLWTLWRIEQAIRKEFLSRTHFKVRRHSGSSAAGAEWTGRTGPIKVTSDPFSGGYIDNAIHELTHVVLEKELSPFAEYGRKPRAEGRKVRPEPQELFVKIIERTLVHDIMGNARRREWWKKAIEKRRIESLSSDGDDTEPSQRAKRSRG